jgi:hypothetical protein
MLASDRMQALASAAWAIAPVGTLMNETKTLAPKHLAQIEACGYEDTATKGGRTQGYEDSSTAMIELQI